MTSKINSYKDLIVWQQAMDLAVATYSLTKAWPKEELYGLTSQIRRSATSIPANIAEGCGRGSDIDFARFLQIAMGSSCETEYYFILTHDLGYLNAEKYEQLLFGAEEVKRMLSALMQTVRS